MAKIDISFEVDRASLRRTLDWLEEGVKDGAEKGLDDTLTVGKEAAQDHIDENRNPFTEPHLSDEESFATPTEGGDKKIEGKVINLLDYAAYVDKGVSGTERARSTPFSYSDSKPPLEKLIPWVERYLSTWDIDTDPDFLESGGEPEEEDNYFNELAEYDLPDNFRTERLERASDFAQNLEVYYDNGESTNRARVIDVYDDEIELRFPGVEGSEIIDPREDDSRDFIGRQDRKVFSELEEGDLVGATTDQADRTIYGEVLSRTKGRVRIADVFDETLIGDFRINRKQFLGTRADFPDKWGEEVDLAESVDDLPDSLVAPAAVDDELFDRLIRSSGRDIAVSIEGERYSATISGNRVNEDYQIDAGFRPDGTEVRLRFSSLDELQGSNYDIIGVPAKIRELRELEEGDKIIVDVTAEGYGDRLNLDELDTDKKYVRATYTTDVIGGDSFQVFRFANFSKRLSPRKFAGKAGDGDSLEAQWDIKDREVGDLVTFEKFGRELTGRYDPTATIGSEKAKEYQLGKIAVFVREENETFTVDVGNVTDFEPDSTFADFTPTPSGSQIQEELGDDYEYNPYLEVGGDLERDEEYLAWDHRQEEYLTVKQELGTGLKAVGEDDRPVKLAGNPGYDEDEYLYPVSVVAAPVTHDNDSETSAVAAVDGIDDIEDAYGKDGRYNLDREQRTTVVDRIVTESPPTFSEERSDRVENLIRTYKDDSKATRGEGRSVLVKAAVEANDITGDTRPLNGNPDPDDELIETVELWGDVSRELLRRAGREIENNESLDRFIDSNTVRLSRGLQYHEMGPLTTSIFDNPDPADDTYTLDVNAIQNYSLLPKHVMGQGIHHETNFDIDDDVLLAPDSLVAGSFQSEREVWVRGGDNYEYNVQDLEFGDSGLEGSNYSYDALIDTPEFKQGNFDELTNDELENIGALVKSAYRSEQSVDTNEGAYRIRQWANEIEQRNKLKLRDILKPESGDDLQDALDIVTGELEGIEPFSFKNDFDQSEIVNSGSLVEYGFGLGASSMHMEVAELPNYDPDADSSDGLAIQTDYSGTQSRKYGVNEMATYVFTQKFEPDSVPDHKADPEDLDWVAKEVADGRVVKDIDEDDDVLDSIDKSRFLERAAVQVLAGNPDGHKENVMVLPNGEVVFIDLDHSAYDLTTEPGLAIFNNQLERTLDEISGVGKELGLGTRDEIKQELTERAEELAAALYDETTGSFSAATQNALNDASSWGDYVPGEKPAQNIADNIKLFATEEYKDYL